MNWFAGNRVIEHAKKFMLSSYGWSTAIFSTVLSTAFVSLLLYQFRRKLPLNLVIISLSSSVGSLLGAFTVITVRNRDQIERLECVICGNQQELATDELALGQAQNVLEKLTAENSLLKQANEQQLEAIKRVGKDLEDKTSENAELIKENTNLTKQNNALVSELGMFTVESEGENLENYSLIFQNY